MSSNSTSSNSTDTDPAEDYDKLMTEMVEHCMNVQKSIITDRAMRY